MKLSRVFSVLPSLFFAVACAAASSGVDHCEVGCPTGGSAQTVVREAYTLNNNMWSITGPLFERHISLPCPPRPRWSFPADTGRLFLSAPVQIRANTRRFCWIRRRPKAPVFVIIKLRWRRLSGGLIRRSRSGPPCRQVSPAA